MSTGNTISVIVPAYNAAPYIEECVASILAQTHRDLEVIVVNDGSTDATSDLVQAMSDPRVRCIDQANGGVCAARNTGLDSATGDHISFLDADDAMDPTDMEEKLAALRAAGVDWVYGDLRYCDKDLVPTGRISQGTDKNIVDTVLLGLETAVPTPCSNLLAHARCFSNGLRLDTTLSTSADQDLAIRLALGYTHVHLPRALHRYRDVPSSMSKSVALYVKDHTTLFAKADREGWFRDPAFRRRCHANMQFAFSGSWWKLAHDRKRALLHAWKAVRIHPPILFRFLGKLFGGAGPR